MENIKLICKDCKKEFDFTVGEQKFYEEKGVLYKINANGTIDEVWNRLLKIINN